MARPIYDVAQDLSTPAAGHHASIDDRVKQIACLVNEHAVALDAVEASQGAGGNPNAFQGQNGDAVALLAGMPVAQPGGALVRASAGSGFALSCVAGLMITGADVALWGQVAQSGPVTLSAATWDAITGDSGGLVPGARYWLDEGRGGLTTAAPTAPGAYVVLVGSAATSTTLLLDPTAPILL